ncbi:DUF4346 domain-containing protein [Candidatus Woesearchaeota archaeon]|nr:DUF4346 domain-containing protein [Candidatus Woesearchaeota archaeon]
MMKKLRVEYNHEKCIGTKTCIAAAPRYFELKGGKAHLVGNYKQEGIQVSDYEADETAYNEIVEAGASCPVNAIKVKDMNSGKVLVGTEITTAPDYREVTAQYDDMKEFALDPNGYFLIRVNHATKEIEVGFCKERNHVLVKITGKKPIDIYQTIINKEKLISRIDHGAYLGRELQKAYMALQHGLEYVQDDELKAKG